MLAGPVCYFLIFWLYVNINSILMAFQTPSGNWSLSIMKSVVRELFLSHDSEILIALRNTAIYFAAGVITIPFHVIIAYFLYRKILGTKVFQIIFYLPAIVSGVAVVAAFQNFVMPDGPLGIILKGLGMAEEKIPFLLQDSRYATWTILFYTLWLGWGGHMLLLGGAMVRIPVEIFESARMDGIGTPREIFQMVMPLIWPTMSTLLILQMTGLFSASGPILLFTNGDYKTTTLAFWIFSKIKYTGESAYNEVAATGLLLTVIGVPVILFVRWLIERVPTVEY